MNDLRQAAQQALEYLDAPPAILWPAGTHERIITALRAALARQAEAVEPQGQLAALEAMLRAEVDRLIAAGIQPQRKPLTEEEIGACYEQSRVNGALPFEQRVFFARAVERKHKIGEER